jgi:hypothetical protein
MACSVMRNPTSPATPEFFNLKLLRARWLCSDRTAKRRVQAPGFPSPVVMGGLGTPPLWRVPEVITYEEEHRRLPKEPAA